jgi:hypothetical protein
MSAPGRPGGHYSPRRPTALGGISEGAMPTQCTSIRLPSSPVVKEHELTPPNRHGPGRRKTAGTVAGEAP